MLFHSKNQNYAKFVKLAVNEKPNVRLHVFQPKFGTGNVESNDNSRVGERDRRPGEAVSKAAEAASLTIFCWTADCERLHLRVEIHLYITRQWPLSCLQSNTD